MAFFTRNNFGKTTDLKKCAALPMALAIPFHAGLGCLPSSFYLNLTKIIIGFCAFPNSKTIFANQTRREKFALA